MQILLIPVCVVIYKWSTWGQADAGNSQVAFWFHSDGMQLQDYFRCTRDPVCFLKTPGPIARSSCEEVAGRCGFVRPGNLSNRVSGPS